jgi:hypothetical protein
MDWVVAFMLGVVVVGVLLALPILMALVSALLTPFFLLIAATLGVWILLQILRDGGDSDQRKGPDL